MKKTGITFIFLFIALAFVPFASAALQDSLEEFFGYIVGTNSGSLTGELIFIKVLVLILIFAIVYSATKRIPQLGDNGAVVFIVALVVSLIGVRFLTTEELINFIWLPQGVLTVVLATLIPFIIGFFFIEGFESTIIRKVGWSAFLVIFGGLAYLRWDDLQLKQSFIPGLSGDAWYFNLAMLYVAIAVISLLLILFDKNIRLMMLKSSFSGVSDRKDRIEAAGLSHDIDNLKVKLSNATTDKERRDISKEIKDKEKNINSILRS